MTRPQQYCTFELADLYLGIEVERVQEVLRSQALTPVPLAPPAVAGLINLRGQIVTAIELRRRLALPPRPSDQPPMNVVLRTPGGVVALLVDGVGDVVEVVPAEVHAPPPTLPDEPEPLVRGVVACGERLMLVLDADRVLTLRG